MFPPKASLVTAIIIIAISAFSFRYSDPPQYKNLQALPKDISRTSMDSTMDHFCNALKVSCEYCHSVDEITKRRDDASDAKAAKLMAREMIRMTDSINQKFFKPDEPGYKNIAISKISCYTCHKGEHIPVSVAPLNMLPEPKRSPWESRK